MGIKLAVQTASQHPGSHIPNWLQIHGGCWLEFAGALLGGEAPAGIFGTYATKGFVVPSIDVDRVLGRLLWFVIFYNGFKWQWTRAKKESSLDKSLQLPLIGPYDQAKQKKKDVFDPYTQTWK